MGVFEKFSRFITGGTTARFDAAGALTQCYVDCVTRTRQLDRHAEMAPQEHAARGLRELAVDEAAQADRLLGALRAANAPVPDVPGVSLPLGATNHWARLVQDLEAHRISMRRLRELAIHFSQELPSTANLFDGTSREEFAHAERLRALIARADPQAID